MKKDKTMLFLRIYKILLSVSIVLAGICLIAGCLSIYYAGNGYSREIVNEMFSKICVPVYICLALVIGSFIVNAVIPQQIKTKPSKDYRQILKNMYAKKDLQAADDAILKQINKEHKKRNIYRIVLVSIAVAAAFVFLSFALNSNNFHQTEITDSMIKAMCVLLPCAAVVFGFAVFTFYANSKSMKNEFELVKQLPNAETAKECEAAIDTNEKKIKILKWCLLSVGIAVLVFGAVMGGFADVLTKAINICTECIGLG